MQKNQFVAIMAGGIGSRFWPMSLASYPKQFLDILHTGKTLIQATYDRFARFIPPEYLYCHQKNISICAANSVYEKGEYCL
jgi:mannose-1-phosphate guanylyltransferase